MNIQQYVERVRAKYATGDATEHSYRSALEALFESIAPGIVAINEPKRVACGAPDLVVRVGGIDIGHCEAKDIDIDLKALKDANLAQKKRYLKGLPNLVYTNGLDFEFYKEGSLIRRVSIGALVNGKVLADPSEFPVLEMHLFNFAAERPQSIGTAKRLVEMMAGKAALIKDIMGRALVADVEADKATELRSQYDAFREHLIHDMTVAEFADVYAETIAYGLFAARLHDTTPDTFSRTEALDLLPKSNPFLRSLFGYIAGVDLDDRVKWVIDELCEVFRAANVHEILKDFGKFTGRNDPFLHFYETFLTEYNPTKRKARGVWYTPEPVVNFIVRAVNDVLRVEFGVVDGLADTSKITIDWETGQTDAKGKRTTIKKQVHRVQILDPATGTGTFLAEVIKQVAACVKGQAEGMWSNYVEQDLIPRLHGFELLMASYAMCHMKLDMVLTELGYKSSGAPPRLGVYLTNSLEEGEAVSQNLFAQWLANEAKSANEIKRQMPIMCVIGNPPYSGHSSNKGAWIDGLLDAYKMEPGGNVRLQERNPKWINDDYVKFIRFAEHMIEKNGEGVLGFITNHGYLDNPTFRGMRWHLLRTFDKIYVLDLHGNAKKLEVSPDGTADKNVFDIQQGVAVIVAVKRGGSGTEPAIVRHADEWGSREAKYASLWGRTLESGEWQQVAAREPFHHFAPRDFELEGVYLRGFSIAELMRVRVLGFQTHRDAFAIAFDRPEMRSRIEDFRNTSIPDEVLRARWSLTDNRDWQLSLQRKRLAADSTWESALTECLYRPFDIRSCHLGYATMDYPRTEIVQHMLRKTNLSLLIPRQLSLEGYRHVLLSNLPAESCAVSSKTKEQNQVFPLYLYPEPGSLETERRINFDPKIYAAIREKAGLNKEPVRQIHDQRDGGKPDELRVFDYIYGVLHSANYRSAYRQFLKTDFPRVPYPASPKVFADVAEKGERLRRLHLMEPGAIGDTPFPFKGDGIGEVCKIEYVEGGRVRINQHQWFEGVPRTAWEFSIGGYQPAQKWLKDRKGRILSFDDVRHYQRLIKILSETDRLISDIELPLGD